MHLDNSISNCARFEQKRYPFNIFRKLISELIDIVIERNYSEGCSELKI